ncbi:hypothetical protein ACL02T_16375 [Pseudonocardia sp. RS010]|uniref:hypothetical protein n=1 Tax=Pseudonocardia sp. RS010 TaxID=3385979 RepID=UPI0039A2FDEC
MQTLDPGTFTDLGVYPTEPTAAAECHRRWGFVVLRDLIPSTLDDAAHGQRQLPR